MKLNKENLSYEFTKRMINELMKTKSGKKKILKVMDSIMDDCVDFEIKHSTVTMFNEIKLDDSRVVFNTK
jgi:hypothetical protein